MPTADPIYLDHAATTPLDERVLEAMLPWLRERYGNAASRQHRLGREAERAVEAAREEVAALLGADPREVVFTSGATEANNLALKGVAAAEAYAARPRRIVSAHSEHRAVLDPLATLAQEHGFEIARLGVDREGRVDLDELEAELARGVLLVSLMAANNETGVLHPLEAIGERARAHGALFHSDATQAAGKVPLDLGATAVDLVSLSAHKLYGPKGVGALLLRRKRPRVRCRPLLDGGGHERGLRSGTLNVPGIVGFGAACALARAGREAEAARVAGLRDRLETELHRRLERVVVNGGRAPRLPGITNVRFEGVDAESLLGRFERVCASSSAACSSAQHATSHVLRAMGLGAAEVQASVRFSLGRATTEREIDDAAAEIAQAVARERAEGPRDACA